MFIRLGRFSSHLRSEIENSAVFPIASQRYHSIGKACRYQLTRRRGLKTIDFNTSPAISEPKLKSSFLSYRSLHFRYFFFFTNLLSISHPESIIKIRDRATRLLLLSPTRIDSTSSPSCVELTNHFPKYYIDHICMHKFHVGLVQPLTIDDNVR